MLFGLEAIKGNMRTPIIKNPRETSARSVQTIPTQKATVLKRCSMFILPSFDFQTETQLIGYGSSLRNNGGG